MIGCCDYIAKFRNISYAHLETAGYIIGWFGIFWRVVLFTLAILLQVIVLDDRPNVLGYMFLMMLAAYCFFALCINILFLVGKVKEMPSLILMYVTIQGFEVILMIMYIILGSPFMKLIGFNFMFWSYLPLFLLLLASFIVSFMYSYRLYHEMHENIMNKGTS